MAESVPGGQIQSPGRDYIINRTEGENITSLAVKALPGDAIVLLHIDLETTATASGAQAGEE